MQEEMKASAWFEDLYKQNEDSHENIPWARRDVNPLLQTYLDENKEHKGKALVIGCGLGDDAFALSNAGYETLAIDISQTALDIAQKRFSGTDITYEKQDIFDMPDKYFEHFDFIFEAFTVQSLPREFRTKMIQAVARSVAKEGELLVVAHKKELSDGGPPWPLTQVEIDQFLDNNLKEISSELVTEPSHISKTRFRILYKKTL
ncbi:methyltransferase domain-containing protein [Sulfurimonas sp. SAG-AH-194-C20]|nr:methyltransferase domain-containing protein [Sulfurimonas sp. SAG-AH-194-C20]MDF1878116.1 methyltransferase domain-containing protein [Sulfurimonas sp. SAG-AH-194-C20]